MTTALELTANDALYPCCWKKRTRVAKIIAVPPAIPLKLLPTSSARTRTNCSAPATLPISSIAVPTKAAFANKKTAATQIQSAPMMVSNELCDVDQNADQRPAPDQCPDDQHKVGDADASWLDQLGHFDGLEGRRLLADLIEQTLLPAQGPDEHGVEPGTAEMAEHGTEDVSGQATGRRLSGTVRPHHHGHCRHGSRQVGGEAIVACIRGGAAKIDQRRGLGDVDRPARYRR